MRVLAPNRAMAASRTFKQLKRELDRTVGVTADDGLLRQLQRLEALTYDLMRDVEFMNACCYDFVARTERYIVHAAPQDRYLVIAQRWAPGSFSGVHDHKTWGVIGVWEGRVREDRFCRVDRPGQRPGYAQLRASTETILRAGHVVSFPPPPGDLHRMGCEGDRAAYSLHLYGKTKGADFFQVPKRASSAPFYARVLKS